MKLNINDKNGNQLTVYQYSGQSGSYVIATSSKKRAAKAIAERSRSTTNWVAQRMSETGNDAQLYIAASNIETVVLIPDNIVIKQ